MYTPVSLSLYIILNILFGKCNVKEIQQILQMIVIMMPFLIDTDAVTSKD